MCLCPMVLLDVYEGVQSIVQCGCVKREGEGGVERERDGESERERERERAFCMFVSYGAFRSCFCLYGRRGTNVLYYCVK